jgi:hypothetical protein
LRDLCSRVPGFDNRFLDTCRGYVLEQLNGDDVASWVWASK